MVGTGKMTLNFGGKLVLITGAGSGIGAATAEMLGKLGAFLVLVDRDEDGLVESVRRCAKVGSAPLGIACDLSQPQHMHTVVKKARDCFNGHLDVLVNGDGTMPLGTLEQTNLECLAHIFDNKVRSMFYLTQQMLPDLVRSRGNIVNISSVCGLRAFSNLVAYNMSKSAIDQFTRSLTLDLGAQGVRVNAVNPGVIRTNLQCTGDMDQATYEQFLEHSKNTHALGRVGEPHEVATCICFLASDLASFVTGVTFSVDGGKHFMCSL